MEKIIISIEGNIGTGKTTFSKILQKKLKNCTIVPEPLEIWKSITDSYGENILQKYYNDPLRWSFSFQILVSITKMINIEETIRKSLFKYIFLDRSLESDINIFEKMLYEQGKINKLEHLIYELLSYFYKKYVKKDFKHFHIYLKCNPEISFQRIKKRNRIEENNITMDYLKDINKYHDDWLLKDSENIIILDCNENFEDDDDKQELMIRHVKEKIDHIIKYETILNKIISIIFFQFSNPKKIFSFFVMFLIILYYIYK